MSVFVGGKGVTVFAWAASIASELFPHLVDTRRLRLLSPYAMKIHDFEAFAEQSAGSCGS